MSNKVILINSLCAGGAERVVSQICDKKGDTIIQIWDDKFYNIDEAKVLALLDAKGVVFFDLFIAAYKLYLYIKRNNIKSINSHLFWSNYLNVFISIFTGHESICTHCVSFESKFSRINITRFFHSIFMKVLVQRASIHTYKSLDMMKEYERNFKFKNGKVIYNPYNFERCFSLSDDNINNFYFRRDRIYLLCVGRFHKTKNQQACLEILAHLPVNYEIIFLGDGDTILNVKSYAKNLGVDKRCFFLGNVRNPFYFYRNCKYYISMSTSEGFPNSLIEAISFGCYPFVYDCKTGPKEILSSLYTKEAIYLNSCVEQYELGTLITRDEYYDIAKIIEKVNINEIIVNNECAKSLISNLNSYTIKKCYDF